MSLRVQFRITEGPMKGRTYSFDQDGQVTFGRSKDCRQGELPRMDPCLSRHHFLLEIRAPQAWVRDLGSAHGTFVNGAPCRPPGPSETMAPGVALQHGDVIRVGDTYLEVSLQWAGQDPPLPPRPDSEPAPSPIEIPIIPLAEELLRPSPEEAPAADGSALGGMTLRWASGPPDIEGFDIQQRLGRSGLGSSFLCRHRVSGRTTVVKVVRSGQPAEGRLLEFLHEALANLAGLRHEGLASVWDYGVADFGAAGWGFCLEMEYCEAGSVQRVAEEKGGRLPPHEVHDIICGSLCGLAYAHALDVVHGNIKPANILLASSRSGASAKVSDFALRRILERVFLTAETSEDYHVVNLPFMSPEQVRHSGCLAQSADVWSAAAVYYFLLTGRHPRNVLKNQDPRVAAIENPAIPIRERYGAVPRGLEDLLEVIDIALGVGSQPPFANAVELWERFRGIPRPPVVIVGGR